MPTTTRCPFCRKAGRRDNEVKLHCSPEIRKRSCGVLACKLCGALFTRNGRYRWAPDEAVA